MNPQISYLADRPEWIPRLAQWIFNEWGRFDPSNTLETNQARMRERLNKDRIPLALVAEFEGSPIGCVNLKLKGMRTHPGLHPWVGSLYVEPSFRDQGVGSALLQRAISEAMRLEVPTLYLWTEVAEHFYQRHGFTTIQRVRYLNQDAKLMRKELAKVT